MSSTLNLFVYGTLTDPSRLHEITGKSYSTSAAYLKDFKKLASRFGYPYIVPHRGSTVKGLLVWDVDEHSLKRLDEYEDEGRFYFRKKVAVLCGGAKVSCEVYVGAPESLGRKP